MGEDGRCDGVGRHFEKQYQNAGDRVSNVMEEGLISWLDEVGQFETEMRTCSIISKKGRKTCLNQTRWLNSNDGRFVAIEGNHLGILGNLTSICMSHPPNPN